MPILERWGIKGDAKELFKQADADGQGMILFNEFTAWSIKKNLDLDTDDDLLWNFKNVKNLWSIK